MNNVIQPKARRTAGSGENGKFPWLEFDYCFCGDNQGGVSGVVLRSCHNIEYQPLEK